MVYKFTEPKLRKIHKSEVKSYFETWLSLQLPRLLKQMDDAEVYRNAFLINTWVQNNSRKKNQAKYRFDKKFVTRVIKNKKMFGTNFKAYVRKYINKKEDLFTFKKIYKDLIKKDFVFQNKVKSSNIFIYDYDALYAYFEKRYKKDKFVFVNK